MPTRLKKPLIFLTLTVIVLIALLLLFLLAHKPVVTNNGPSEVIFNLDYHNQTRANITIDSVVLPNDDLFFLEVVLLNETDVVDRIEVMSTPTAQGTNGLITFTDEDQDADLSPGDRLVVETDPNQTYTLYIISKESGSYVGRITWESS